jgi:hypothetical protein
MYHARHWTAPYWEPATTTKESLQNEEGPFDWKIVSHDTHALEAEINLIGSENAREAASQLYAQLLAFEAMLISGGLDEISIMGKNCEPSYDRLTWAFRTDLGVSTPEPTMKPPREREIVKGHPSPGK